MLELQDVSFSYGEGKGELQHLNLTFPTGSFTAILGESGCGKSTLLNLIYGLLQENSGRLLWKGEQLLGADNHLVPGHPMMKYVPQEYQLMPYTTVFENVGEHLSIQLDHRTDRIMHLLEVVDMTNFADRKVKSLSGGQKQRVAIAKSLAQEPELLLLDEAFSNIDHYRKNDLRRRLFAYLQEQEITCIMATHDRDDVLPFSHQTIIMRHGKIVDNRRTKDCYENPINEYAASLFHEYNCIPAGLLTNEQEILCYPEHLSLSNVGKKAQVVNSFFMGSHYLIQLDCDGTQLFTHHKNNPKKGTTVQVSLLKS
jgi:ABC-type Fe3+/spermidine/putrescine transport system ATPase subunit